jgi:L-threonylcarbamoyladenylate synthase
MAFLEVPEAIALLERGEVIALPTDTLYGLAASVRSQGAIDEIFRLKGRPQDKPLPVLGESGAAFTDIVRFDDRAELLASLYWPGPLTIVLPRVPAFTCDLGGSGDTVGVRVPRSTEALDVLAAAGALAVTSANPSGRPAATTAAEVVEYFGEEVPVLDGGPTAGEPSTTISLAGGLRVLRAGALSERELRQSLMS